MRTTVVIPDEIIGEVRKVAGDVPLSRFVRESVVERLGRLQRQALVSTMAEGYRAEAESTSLDSEWSVVEIEGL